ncbi:glucose 1-dehydrogenase [Humibacter albus]|jgi:NAD(P)-dependent dehydrogenase (short-subunit alcohol dehydrogenase family)|uniref:glucose 1-dehydrogenase n=1 Tax=Humibacter albus TaxID=427754 RepID=UPI0003B4FBC2|nr:glucose 1-dehydrogenase [Humibacter albus]
MVDTQYIFDNPVTRYPKVSPPPEEVPEPGSDADLRPPADHGEASYVGTNRLVGRKAIVTGGDSGIGAAVAIAFAREGADVAIVYTPEEEEDAQHVADQIRDAGRKVLTLPGDLVDPAFCTDVIARAVEDFGGVDILVNNAGKQVFCKDIAELPDDQFDRTMKTNIYAMFHLTKAAVPHMPPGSTIINTTSVQAYLPSDVLVDYATTKAAINAFTKAIAAQLAPRGIRANAVAPGPIWTPLQPSMGQPPKKLPDFGSQTALGRAGQPAELAPAYVFLASPESSYVVGATLAVTGGMPTP